MIYTNNDYNESNKISIIKVQVNNYNYNYSNKITISDKQFTKIIN